jgi:hypothetical protein
MRPGHAAGLRNEPPTDLILAETFQAESAEKKIARMTKIWNAELVLKDIGWA